MINNLVARLTIDAVRYEDHVTDVDTTVAARLKTMDDNIAAAKDTISANEKIINTNETNLTDLRKEIGATNRIDELNGVIAGADERKADLTELIGQTESMAEAVEEVNEALTGYHGTEHKTLQERLDHDFDNVNQRVNDSMLLDYEGIYITADNTYYGLQKDTVVKGRTLQNIFKEFGHTTTTEQVGRNKKINTRNGSTGATTDVLYQVVKPNTTYTMFINILESTLTQGYYAFCSQERRGFSNSFHIMPDLPKPGVYRYKITSKETLPENYGIDSYLFDCIEGEYIIIAPPIILEGDYTQTPIEELAFIEGIKSVGDKSKNLCDNSKNKQCDLSYDAGLELSTNSNCLCTDFIPYNPNKNYTHKVHSDINITASYRFYDINKNYVGTTVTTDVAYCRLRVGHTQPLNTNTKFQLEEGTQDTPYQEYYDGYKISVKSCGKNLAKTINSKNYETKGNGEVKFYDGYCTAIDKSGWAGCFIVGKDLIKVKPNTIYYGEIGCEEGSEYLSQTKLVYKCLDINNNVITTSGAVTFSNDAVNFYKPSYNNIYEGFLPLEKYYKYVKFSSEVHGVQLIFRPITSTGTISNTFKNILFVETNKQPTYEPYQESNYSYILNEPLRSLPNGVCDELDITKGVVRRRVGEYTFSGNESMYIAGEVTGNVVCIYCSYKALLGYDLPARNNILCNTLPVYDYDKFTDTQLILSSGSCPIISIKTENLTSADIDGVRQWLKDNSTTIYYELPNPYEEQVDIKYLKSFNGQTHIMSDNILAPYVKTRIPSDVNSVVMGLRRENEAIREEYEQQQLDNLETTLEQEVRVTMLEMGV